MTTELRVTINLRISADANTSMQFTHLCDTEDEAREAGYSDKLLVDAWVEGFAAAGSEPGP